MGGMLVAAVMKFAGNILRNFAQACAIIVGGLGSWGLFGFQITLPFVAGVALVILSIFIYGAKPEQLTEWAAAIGLVRRPALAIAARRTPAVPRASPPSRSFLRALRCGDRHREPTRAPCLPPAAGLEGAPSGVRRRGGGQGGASQDAH